MRYGKWWWWRWCAEPLRAVWRGIMKHPPNDTLRVRVVATACSLPLKPLAGWPRVMVWLACTRPTRTVRPATRLTPRSLYTSASASASASESAHIRRPRSRRWAASSTTPSGSRRSCSAARCPSTTRWTRRRAAVVPSCNDAQRTARLLLLRAPTSRRGGGAGLGRWCGARSRVRVGVRTPSCCCLAFCSLRSLCIQFLLLRASRCVAADLPVDVHACRDAVVVHVPPCCLNLLLLVKLLRRLPLLPLTPFGVFADELPVNTSPQRSCTTKHTGRWPSRFQSGNSGIPGFAWLIAKKKKTQMNSRYCAKKKRKKNNNKKAHTKTPPKNTKTHQKKTKQKTERKPPALLGSPRKINPKTFSR